MSSDVDAKGKRDLRHAALAAQAAYFTLTGVWPLIHRASFEAVTGRKEDFWLAQTVGALVCVIGITLGFTALGRKRAGSETLVLAAGTAAALGIIEASYVAMRRIRAVYLLDAILEVAFVIAGSRGGWTFETESEHRSPQRVERKRLARLPWNRAT